MELEELYKLMEEFGKSGLGKLEYKNGDCEVKLEMPEAAPVYNTFAAPQATVSTAAAAPVPGAAAPQPAAAAAGTPEPAAPAGAFIRSPLVGTYYAAPGEGSEPYVTAGSSVISAACVITGAANSIASANIAGFNIGNSFIHHSPIWLMNKDYCGKYQLVILRNPIF